MKIACLGWGSLLWDPQDLLIDKQWNVNGPLLPVEFCRQSGNGRMTLVINRDSIPLRVLWSLVTTIDPDIAIESLRVREGIPKGRRDDYIGVLHSDEVVSDDPIRNTLILWLQDVGLDAVIWTDLPPKFNEINGQKPSKEEAIAYLRNLEGNARDAAEEYIRRAPAQIMTDYRRAFENELGWINSN
ncbi:hypothetical protein D3C87_298950 [compost metagenome]